MKTPDFIDGPKIFISHNLEKKRDFIGPGMILLQNGNILMIAPWGRPPTNFDQLIASKVAPETFISTDNGRSWTGKGEMNIEWNLAGMISDGGITLIRLKNNKLAFLAHRHVNGLHGGGIPVFSISDDEGKTWSPAKMLTEKEDVYYVMNDRLIQLENGRLIVPVACLLPENDRNSYSEGKTCVARCFYSDNGGDDWELSDYIKISSKIDSKRGMAEAAIVECNNEHLYMLARTGTGYLYSSSSSNGGETWTIPETTTMESPCAPLTLKKMPNGGLIVFYNHGKPLNTGAFFPRNPLVYATSYDNGKSWSEPVCIDKSGIEPNEKHLQHIYPAVCFTDEGILLMYSTHTADPKGSFAKVEGDIIEGLGGKVCILKYPLEIKDSLS